MLAPALAGCREGALVVWLALAAAPALAGCGDDASEPPRSASPARKPVDGGREPAAPEPDARPPDSPDHQLMSGDVALCTYDDDDVFERPGSPRFHELAIATDERGFALVHHDLAGALMIEAVPVAQLAEPSVRLIAAADEPGHAALAASERSFALLYRDGSALQARILEPSASPLALTQRLAEPGAGGGERFALTAHEDRFVVAWSEPGEDGALAVYVQTLDLDGQPLGEPLLQAAASARAPDDLQLGPLDAGRTLLAWHERDENGAGAIMGHPLDRMLAPEGDPALLSKNAVAAPRFDLAARERSAGVLYQAREGGVRDTVKFRHVDQQGVAAQEELSMVRAPGRARGGALAPFGQGYAVAYRTLPSLGVDAPAIRIAFINASGRIVHEAELAQTSEDGGPPSASATVDGHVLIAWTTAHASGDATTHAIQLDCPGALILCGGGR